MADYDDVLVTLLGDVATAYVQYRTTEERIKYATHNANIQAKVLAITQASYRRRQGHENRCGSGRKHPLPDAGRHPRAGDHASDCQQPAVHPARHSPGATARQAGDGAYPRTPADVVVGIPADLLRRRPDVRRAERQAAAQCAQIGVAESAFYPHISIDGIIDYQATRFKDLFNGRALSGSIGPSFHWDILQYGRLLNNVRLQQAEFFELVEAYKQSVLTANQEVENGLVTFLKAQERYQWQKKSVDAGRAAVDTVRAQWQAGTVDFTRVAQLLQNQVVLEDTLAQVQGEIATGLITVYEGLGGGWQIRLNGCTPGAAPARGRRAIACPSAA